MPARVAPEMPAIASNSAAALQADLEHLKVTLKAELRAELKAELLAELRDDKPAAAAEAPASVQPKASVAMVPITYEEAFVAIGGESELAKHMEASRQLQARVSDATLDAELKLLLPRDYTKRTGFSTKLINQPFVRDLDALYAQANAIYGSYDKCIRELAMKLGAKALVPPLKGEVRARMKAIFKYRDVSSEGVAWYRLTDLVRATLEFGDLASLYAGLQAVVDHFGEGVQELNDRYMQPLAGGYRDVQLVVRFEGHMCELQLSTEPMTRAKKTTGHRDFEVVRELTAAVAEGNLGRVVNALEFGREHLGSSGDGASALSKLLRSDAANTLPHDAAARGHAEILHAFLLHGADANAQDGDGDTPLHCAVFGGHERCVWVLLDVGRPNLDVLNSDGQTPLVKGYLMLWQRPPEQAVRAVSTLAQVAGVARVTAARSVVDEQVRKKLSNNRALVDVAADGNCEKMLAELREYANPNSRDKEGQSALEATITNGQHDALNLLLDFKVSLKNLDGKPSLLELASTAGQPKMMLALLEAASERMELEQLIDSLRALRVVGELEPKVLRSLGGPFAAGIATKLSSGSLGTRIAAVSVLDCLEPSALPSGAATLMDTTRLEKKVAKELMYVVNHWKEQEGERRAGRMLGFSDCSVTLESTFGNKDGDKAVWELYEATVWNPNTGVQVSRGSWNPCKGRQGTAGPSADGREGGMLFYIVNRWKAENGEGRNGKLLGFSGENVSLESCWGDASGDKAVWELFPADTWDPNTKTRVAPGQWNSKIGSSGAAGAAAPTELDAAGCQMYYVVSRWRADDAEGRSGRMLGFGGNTCKLEGTWGGGGDKVPWQMVVAHEWNANTGKVVARGTWNPLKGGQGE